MMAHEDRAGVADFRQQRRGIGDRELEMLRRDAVRDRAGFVEIADLDQRAAVARAMRR